MYPLSVILIGREETTLSPVRRELRNQDAAIVAEFADVDQALAELPDSVENPCLVVLHAGSAADVESTRRVSSAFVGRPILTLIEATSDPAVILHAMRAGAAQVVPLPLQVEDFSTALNCIAVQYGHSGVERQVIAVSGVTDGCGATTVALNLAYEIAYLGKSHCLLVELALRRGDLAYYLNIEPPYTTEDLFRMGKRLDVYAVQRALTHVARNFDVLVGSYRSVTPFAVSSKDVLRVLTLTRQLAHVVVLDVPCTYDEHYFETLAAAHQVVLVADQRVPAMRALRMLSATLGGELSSGSPCLVINRYDPQVPGFCLGELGQLLEQPELLSIAKDCDAVPSSIRHGQSLRMEAPAAPALADIDRLACRLLGLREFVQTEPTLVPARLGRLIRACGPG